MSGTPGHPKLDGNLIADTSIRQPVFVTMLMLLAIVAGLLAYTMLPVNQLPDIALPTVVVTVAYPGAGPESVADQVARPIEDELSTISGLSKITSNAAENVAVIIAEFNQDVDPNSALQNVREKVSGIRAQLPQDIREPVFQRIEPNQDPILQVAFTSTGSLTSQQLRARIKNELVPQIQRAPGVGSTTVTGGLERQINVELTLARLQSLRILPAQVSNAIAAANTNVGVGNALVGAQNYNLRTPSVFKQPNDIAATGIPGTAYTIADVGVVVDGNAEPDTYTRLNGGAAIILAIRKQTGTNTTAVADAALGELERAVAAYPDLAYTVIVNQATQVRSNVRGAIEEIIIAVVFAMLVVWLFFRDLRNTVVTIIGLPVIIIGTFAMIAAFGISINIVSLLAIAVSVGLVIDDAIVVRENIFRYIEHGYDPWQAASKGTAQVATSVLAMTLTLIAVFVPVTFTTGITGTIFKSFGITVACAMTLSLIEAFTLAPMLSAHWFKPRATAQPDAPEMPDDAPQETATKHGASERLYVRLLDWSLRHRLTTLAAGALIVVASLVALSGLKTSFLPVPENRRLGIAFELPPSTPLNVTDERARAVEQILLQDPGVEAVMTTVGGSRGMYGGGGNELAQFLLKLRDNAATTEVQARLRLQLAGLPKLTFSQSSYKYGESTAVQTRPIQVKLRTTGALSELAPVAAQVQAALANVAGFADIDSSYSPGKPELQYELIQANANDYGLTNRDLAMTMRTLVDGNTAAVFRENGKDYDIVVQLRAEDRASVETINTLRLPIGRDLLPLSSIARLKVAESPTVIRRAERMNEILIGGNNVGRNVNDVQRDVEAQLRTITLPANVTLIVGGASDDQSAGFTSLLLAMALSVSFVYMVLASQFGSFLQPLVLMLAMPLSFIGAFLALRLANLELNIVALIGLLLLLGLVVKNSILLIDFTNVLRADGMEKHAALIHAGATRLRPILMTSITVIAGNIPTALGLGDGAELRRGLGMAVIGGMITSTLLTLVLVPAAYSLLDAAQTRFGQLFQRQPAQAEAPAPAQTAGSHAEAH